MTDTERFEKECQDSVDRIAKELLRRYEGNDDEVEELENQLSELEDNEPEDPDPDNFEDDDAYDKAFEDYEKAVEEWEKEKESLEEKIDKLKEEGDLRDYFDDYLDVDYIVNSAKEYESARIWVTVGGPGIWIDTEKSTVEISWGSTRKTAYLSYNVRDEIDDIFRDIYEIS